MGFTSKYKTKYQSYVTSLINLVEFYQNQLHEYLWSDGVRKQVTAVKTVFRFVAILDFYAKIRLRKQSQRSLKKTNPISVVSCKS